MKTKAQIVQELLNDKKISAEDAVVLLQNVEVIKEKEYVYIPQPFQVFPPINPFDGPTYSPFRVTCAVTPN